jgi:hypothetical protein
MRTELWWKNLKGKYHSEDLGIEDDNIEWILGKQRWKILDWVLLIQDRDQ